MSSELMLSTSSMAKVSRKSISQNSKWSKNRFKTGTFIISYHHGWKRMENDNDDIVKEIFMTIIGMGTHLNN